MDEGSRPSIEERIERLIRTMWAESLLGPLLVVILGHLVAFLVPAIVLGFRDRSLPALAAIAILLVASGAALHRDWRRYRRPGPIGTTVLIVWALAAPVSWAAARYGVC